MPLDGLNINFPPSISIPVRRLQHTFTTFIRGLLNPAQALAEPFAYAEYIQKQKQQKIEAERASRITTKKKLPKVNRDLAKRLLENQEAEGEAKTGDDVNMKKKSKKNKGLSSDLMEDERFTKMFENKADCARPPLRYHLTCEASYNEPNPVAFKGYGKRLKKSKEKATPKAKGRCYNGCGKIGVSHDKRNCDRLVNVSSAIEGDNNPRGDDDDVSLFENED